MVAQSNQSQSTESSQIMCSSTGNHNHAAINNWNWLCCEDSYSVTMVTLSGVPIFFYFFKDVLFWNFQSMLYIIVLRRKQDSDIVNWETGFTVRQLSGTNRKKSNTTTWLLWRFSCNFLRNTGCSNFSGSKCYC